MKSVLSESDTNKMEKSSRKSAKNRKSIDKAASMVNVVESISYQVSQKPLYFQSAIQGNLTEKKSKRKRDSSVDYGFQSSPSKMTIIDKAKQSSSIDIDWEEYKSWPMGLREEENALSEYLRRLEQVNVEQKTKKFFIEITKDRPVEVSADVEEFFTLDQVRKLEVEAAGAKEELAERSKAVESTRKEIELLTDELREYDSFKRDLEEANKLTDSIKELGEELRKLRESGEIKSDSKEHRRSNVTKEEAEQIIMTQVDNIVNLQGLTDDILRETELKKRALAEEVKGLDSLKVKQKSAEKLVKELKSKERDPKVEGACKVRQATLSILKSLLGVISIQAPEPTCLSIVYQTRDRRAQQIYPKVTVLLYFTHAGGQLDSYEFQNTKTGEELTSLLAPLHSPSRAHLDRAVAANDASLLIQETLVCIESARADG